jgi:hypothetical protein
MEKIISATLLAAALAWGAGCDSKDPPPDQTCGFANVCAKDLTAFPFVNSAIAVSDVCAGTKCATTVPPEGGSTAPSLTHPEPGTLCISGELSSGGFALVGLQLLTFNSDGTEIVASLDATAKGIVSVAVTIDTPPPRGVWFNTHNVVNTRCPDASLDCFYPPNFNYMKITSPGRVVAPLAQFISEDDPNQSVDASVLAEVFFQVEGGGPYDFCVHDLAFLDAAGNPVTP